MKHVEFFDKPELREPVLIAAFAGWNDGAEAATTAAQYLIREGNGRRLAEVEPEEFYVFTETRPHVRIAGGSQRRIDWPANEFYLVRLPETQRDLIVLVGVEPQLRWKTFTKAVLGVAKEYQVGALVSLGALLADVPHTLAPRVAGSAGSPELRQRLRRLHFGGSRYEGPTGILSVLGAAALEAGMQTASLWGSVPHYISSTANPRVALALLRSVGSLLELPIDLAALEREADSFDAQVSQAVAQNPEVAEYVRQLEQQHAGEAAEPESEGEKPPTELPSSDVLIKELEEFLKRRPPASGEGEGPQQ